MKKENEESNRRAIIMVISNSTFNFLLKIPLLIPSLNDFRLVFYFQQHFKLYFSPVQNILNQFSSTLNFEFFCLNEKSCQLFQSFGNCLVFLSLSTIVFFIKKFDMNFKTAFTNVFSAQNTNANIKYNILLFLNFNNT